MRDMVVEVDGMEHRHWPMGWVVDIRPVDPLMKHHGAADVHYGANGPLTLTIAVMSTGPGKPRDLLEGT